MKYHKVIAVFFLIGPGLNACAANYTLQSPNQAVELKIETGDKITYSISLRGRPIVTPSPISMSLVDGKVLGASATVVKVEQREINEILKPVVPAKRSEVPNNCREMTLVFAEGFDLIFRAYDDGAAWRFRTRLNENIRVKDEQVVFRFVDDRPIAAAISADAVKDDMVTSCESLYQQIKLSEYPAKDVAYPPLIVDVGQGVKIAITESDVMDYPGLWLKRGQPGPNELMGCFSRYVIPTHPDGYNNQRYCQRADYIAQVDGTRNFPWRLIVVAENDAKLIDNELVFCLSPESALADTSWIKPGKVVWDWWSARNLWNVDFESGLNTANYKYNIDFAARNGIEYVLLDEDWSQLDDLFKTDPNIDLPELLRYSREKQVGLMVWCACSSTTLEKQQEEAFSSFEKWGIKGVKIDFMEGDDQAMVHYYRVLAKAAAAHHLLLDFHGAHKETGLRREYPNVLTREGVLGLENDKNSTSCTPEHDVTLPFTRMLMGPMDYTPGAMNNAQKMQFAVNYHFPMSQGTRCHQLSMYVIYESPLQMLADSPSAYQENPCCLDFIAKTPTTWDQTRVLDAKFADYVLLARRKGDQWFVGAMTDGDSRELVVDFSFLSPGDYQAAICADGVNAPRVGKDHTHKNMTVNAATKLKIKLAPGGGWAVRLCPAP